MTGETTSAILKGLREQMGEDAFKGLCIGTSISSLAYVIDRMSCQIHVQGDDHNHLLSSFRRHPLRGLLTHELHGAAKFSFAFHFKPKLEKELNTINPSCTNNCQFAIGISAAMANYATAPMSVVKSLRFNGVSASTIYAMPLKYYFNGMNANALRDMNYFSSYFAAHTLLGSCIDNVFARGAISGLIGGLFSNPFVVIGNKQKVPQEMLNKEGIVPFRHNKTMVGIAREILNESGIKGFYPKFLWTSAPRVIIQGWAIELGTWLANQVSAPNTTPLKQRA